jgi:hypothetical protein
MGRGAALVSGAELAEFHGQSLSRAMGQIPSLRNRGLIQSPGCILVNGVRSGVIPEFSVDDVEAVEVFYPGTDYTGTLADRGCPSTAALPRLSSKPFSRPRRNNLGAPTWVIWLKR